MIHKIDFLENFSIFPDANCRSNIAKIVDQTSTLCTGWVNPVFVMLLAEKSPEIIPKLKEDFFISESFTLN